MKYAAYIVAATVVGFPAVLYTIANTHMPYKITQCYLPPAFTTAEAGTRLSDAGEMQG